MNLNQVPASVSAFVRPSSPMFCDQLAMSRLPRASFALLLALLPATATILGAIVLAQIPSRQDLLGVLLVMVGVSIAPVSRAKVMTRLQRRIRPAPARRA